MAKEKREWTKAQSAAIETTDKDLLVSAAAGSGKTATLTERIIRSITKKEAPSDISKMLVVTFTRAAASELRQKIFKAVSEALADDPTNDYLASQLIKLENANICTIDSFYFDILRENSSSLGLVQNMRIADTSESAILARQIMDETVTDFYNTDTERFSRFAESFVNVRGMSRLPEILLDLYSNISSYPEGIEFLRSSAEQCFAGADGDFFECSFGKVLKRETVNKTKYFIAQLEDIVDEMSLDEELEKKYLPSFAYDLSFCKDLLISLEGENGYSAARAQLGSYSPIKLKSLSNATEFSLFAKDTRTKITKEITALSKKAFGLSSDAICEAMRETARITLVLHETLESFERRLLDEKMQRSMFDFDDIRRFVMKLLVDEKGEPTETARNISERYTDIYIDEYQDVDRVQDMIFRSISKGNNRFMVGDIKQSIYGFRGAEPDVFADYRRRFPLHESDKAKNSANEVIFMSNNFRCDENIILFTNRVCSYLFGLCAESIGYSAEDDLVFSKKKPSDDYVSQKVRIAVMVPPEDEDSDYKSSAENNREAEALYIASEISRLLAKGKKADGTHIEASDIAIMFRSGNMKEYLTKALDEYGIEYCGAENSRYFEDPEVLLVLSLLNVIDNPHRDIHLAGVLRSPLFDVSLESLVILRRYCDSSYSLFDCLCEYAKNESNELSRVCRVFLEELDALRDMTLSLPAHRLLKNIYSSRRFSAAGLCDSENLTMLYEYARRFESGSFKGLYNFIEYINRLISDGVSFDAGNGSSAENKVSLMTIHHSKGLEYPVCFLCGTSGEFNKSDFKDSLILDSKTGVAMKLADGSGFARINTPLREAIAAKKLGDAVEEEMRVLYVALTRAREYLYITGGSKKPKEELLTQASHRRRYSMRYTVMKCKSYLEWILTAIADTELSDVAELCFVEADKVEHNRFADIPKLFVSEAEPCEETVTMLLDKFSFDYPYGSLHRLPAKISVSRLSPDVLDESGDTLSLFEEPKKTKVPPILLGSSEKQLSAAERGTATHLFLQFCDFERAGRTGVREELERLVQERYIPSNAKELVFEEELELFLKSELFDKIMNAREVIREQRFNLLMPPSMFSKDPEFIEKLGDEKLAVQGVVDLIVIDSEGRLCLYDYKTDRISKEEKQSEALLADKMRKSHSEQLSYYKLAAERLFGTECHTVEVYSTAAARTVKIF